MRVGQEDLLPVGGLDLDLADPMLEIGELHDVLSWTLRIFEEFGCTLTV